MFIIGCSVGVKIWGLWEALSVESFNHFQPVIRKWLFTASISTKLCLDPMLELT